jgi:hypothetical protein
MAQEFTEKLQIINSFLEANGIKKTSQVVEFMSIVEYVELSISDVTKVQMQLDNYYFGKIELYETYKIDISKVHTGFAVPYMEYQLENQTLVIKGTASPAKGGVAYTVRITPLLS